MNIDLLIRKSIRSLNEEEKKEEKPKNKKIKAKVGRGNLKTYIRQGKARSENDPEGLLKDLGVSKRFSDEPRVKSLDFREKVVALLRNSFDGDAAMSTAFTGIRYSQGRDEAQVSIDKNFITSRDGTMFVNNILRAAQNAEALSLDEDITIEPSGNQEVRILFIKD